MRQKMVFFDFEPNVIFFYSNKLLSVAVLFKVCQDLSQKQPIVQALGQMVTEIDLLMQYIPFFTGFAPTAPQCGAG
jgi:hypothetical protein